MSKVPTFDVFLAMDWFTFVQAAWEIPLRLATRSEKLVGKAAEVLAAATFFQVYLFPVFKHLTGTAFTVEVAFGCLHVAPILVAPCALVGITSVATVNVRQVSPVRIVRFMGLV
jgi:hypothetical protein